MCAVLILASEFDCPPLQGNLLLDRLLGAEVHLIPPNSDPLIGIGEQEATRVAELMEDLRHRGERPYLIPLGGSSPVSYTHLDVYKRQGLVISSIRSIRPAQQLLYSVSIYFVNIQVLAADLTEFEPAGLC